MRAYDLVGHMVHQSEYFTEMRAYDLVGHGSPVRIFHWDASVWFSGTHGSPVRIFHWDASVWFSGGMVHQSEYFTEMRAYDLVGAWFTSQNISPGIWMCGVVVTTCHFHCGTRGSNFDEVDNPYYSVIIPWMYLPYSTAIHLVCSLWNNDFYRVRC